MTSHSSTRLPIASGWSEESMPTEVAGRFIMKREIGRGGMCAVFRAEHRYSRRAVAVKLLLPALAKKSDMRARLLREAVALGRIRHDNVVQVLDAGIDGDTPFLVLELMEGRTLEGILAARGSLTAPETVHIVRRVASALEAAHRSGVIHRDVKPGNVFIVQGPVTDGVKLGDFGLAHTPSEDALGAPKLTGHGVVIGTPEYMSPDQLLALPSTPRNDIWALGILLYECLTGKVPFVGSYYDVLVQATAARAPVPTDFPEDVPPALVGIITRALSPSPTTQYRSAAEMVAALDETKLACTDLRILSGSPEARRTVAEAPKRAHVRAPFVTPIRIDGKGVSAEGRCENISSGGLMVFLSEEVPLGTAVNMRFCLPISGRVETCAATVRWSKKNEPTARHRFAIGLEFFYLQPEVEAEVLQYVALMGTSRRR